MTADRSAGSYKAGARPTTARQGPETLSGLNAERAGPEGVPYNTAKSWISGGFEAGTERFQGQPLQHARVRLLGVDLEHGDAHTRAKYGRGLAGYRAELGF